MLPTQTQGKTYIVQLPDPAAPVVFVVTPVPRFLVYEDVRQDTQGEFFLLPVPVCDVHVLPTIVPLLPVWPRPCQSPQHAVLQVLFYTK